MMPDLAADPQADRDQHRHDDTDEKSRPHERSPFVEDVEWA